MNFRLVAVFFIALIQFSHAATLNNWNIDISINDDKTAEWVVTLLYDGNVTKSDYFVASKITGTEVSADGTYIDCSTTQKEFGTSVVCSSIRASRIVYKFRTLGLVTDLQNLEQFGYRFPVTQLVDSFKVVVKLPLGSGLVEKSRLEGTAYKRYEPDWGQEGSEEGRRISVTWQLDKPVLGAEVDVSLIYEPVIGINQLISLAIIFGLVGIFLLFIFSARRRPISNILPILTEGERKVMEILLREKKDVDQRRIVKEVDFSKSKVSRIIQDLVKRGLIETTRKGRTNLVRLKKQE
jgi:hypothetical protein